MKIAYICADPGIPVLGNKGASVHVREFTGALAALSHQVRIYSAAGAAANTPGEKLNATRAGLIVLAPAEHIKDRARLAAANLARLESQRAHVHLFSEFLHLLADPEFVQAARPLLEGFRPDLIIARHALFSTAGAALARALECPYILEVNAPLIDERRRYWGLTLDHEAEETERAALSEAHLLVAVSEGVRAYLLRYGAPQERIVVMPNGVNLSRFHLGVDGSEVRRRYGLEGKLVIGFSGSLKPWHGVDSLVKAFARVRNILAGYEEESERLRLLIVGNGPQRELLGQLSRELALDETVTFAGAIAHDEMPAHLAAMDMAVAPYLASDNFYFSPLKVMEYLAMGLPVIAPRLGQIPSLVQGGQAPCGLIYPPDDQHELVAALLALAVDGDLRRRLSLNGAAQVRQRSSWQSIAQQVISCAVASPRRTQARELEIVK